MPNNGGLSITHLFTTLMTDISLLFRKEMELARAEMSQKVSNLGSGAIYIAIGGLLAFAALLFLLAAAAFAIALTLPAWAATLIVGGGVLIIALLFLAGGYGKVRLTHLKPERTVQALRDDAAFAREQFRGS